MRRKNITLLVAAILFVVLSLGLAWIAVLQPKDDSTDSSSTSTNTQEDPQPQDEAKPTAIDLQPVVDEWLVSQSADFGIVVYDFDNERTIAAHQPDEQYFAASLYKLFVAYLALLDFQNNQQAPNELLIGGFTRRECVEKMIRESHSPCGEATMSSMGQENLRVRVSDMGINNTTFAGITTTAQDSALILQYIQQMRDLNQQNTEFLKDAMRDQDQRFKNGLAKGAPEATWETKVGWNEDQNYHDVGIVTMPDGRKFAVAILSYNNGSSQPIADFAATIYGALKQD